MRASRSLWFWRSVWGALLLAGLVFFVLYAWLPGDGATGDLESFTRGSYRVQWLLEKRQDGLQVGDLILRAGGRTADEWLSGALRGPEWRSGGIVTYEVLRAGRPMTLQIRLAPVRFRAILARWAPQLMVSLALLVIGSVVFWRRPQELAARLLMLFCISIAVHLWGDAYNFQYAVLPWRWAFGLHLFLEHLTFSLNYASICHFCLIFPAPHPLLKRWPRLMPLVLYTSTPLTIAAVMVLSRTWSEALVKGNHASLVVVVIQIGLTFAAGIRSLYTARDPVSRAQIRWITWGGCVAIGVTFPGYVLPIMLTGRPLIPHPITMMFTIFVPLVYAIAILRYRLFDIEVIVNRTLVYGTLTAVLGSLYLLLAPLVAVVVRGVLRQEDDSLVLFVTMLSIALAFDPLRQRVQRLIDRTFYRAKLDYQRVLPGITERLATSIVLDQLAALLIKELPQRLHIAWATLAVLEPAGEHFTPLGADSPHSSLPVDSSVLEYLHRLGRPLLRLQPPPQLPGEMQVFLDRHSIEMGIPLIVGTELVGLYNLGPKLSGDAYSRDEVRLLHFIGQQAAIAVENSRLLQATERQAEELVVLHEAAVAFSSGLEVEAVLHVLAERLGEALNVTSAFIYDWREESSKSTVLAEWVGSGSAAGEHGPGRGMVFDLEQHPAALQALQEKRPLAVHATDLDRDSVEQGGWQSQLIVPLMIRDRAIGYAKLWETRQRREFTQAEVRLCQTLAADAAAALERAHLFQAEREQRGLIEALDEAAAVVSSTLDLDQVLDLILDQVERVVPGDAFNIMLIEGSNSRVVRWRRYERLGVVDQMASLCVPTAKHPALAGMTHTGEPVVVPDTTENPGWGAEEGWQWLRSYMAAPIRVASQVVGFLNVHGTQRGQFSAADVHRLAAFANHAATALHNARLYAEIKESLEEKEVLLREIHHRVKNNLQVVSSLLYLQSKEIKDPVALEMFQESWTRVRSMALVHERLYRSQDLSRIDFATYVQNLASYLFRVYGAQSGAVQLRTDVDDAFLGIDLAIPCGLIINELASNCLKHAFPDGREGQVWITLEAKEGGLFTLMVGDDGIGFPEDLDFRDTPSLGLQLVNSLVTQLDGTIELDRGSGTLFSITFSESK